MRPHGHVRISRSKPQAQGVCDRCGRWFNHKDLMWQFDWVGARLQNLRILICQPCRDKPQENIRTIILPPDPMPIMNPRPESFPSDNNPISGIGYDPAGNFPHPPGSNFSTVFGSLTGGGGPESVVFGAPKFMVQAASLTPSSTGINPGNSVGINWSQIPGNPKIPSQLNQSSSQSYLVNQTIVNSPLDAPFLGSGPTTVVVEGSNDGASWTTIASVVSQGIKNETLTLASPNSGFYGYHRVRVVGDGVTSAAISFLQFSTVGPSLAQTGSELGA